MRENPTTHLAVSRRLLILVGAVLVGGLWAYSTWSMLDLRQQAWDRARRDAAGLLETSGRALARDIDLYDLSLRTIAERMNMPVLEEVPAEVRHLALFDRVSRASGYGSIFVLDQSGRSFLDSNSLVPRRLDGSDRLYFTTHRDNPDAGLFIGRPWVTRVSGLEMIPLSRRFSYADGSFAGVIVGAIKLSHFREVFDRLRGQDAFAISLRFPDGTVVMSDGTTDGPPLHGAMAFTITAQVGPWPLQIVIGADEAAIWRTWRSRIRPILCIAVLLTAALIAALATLWRELNRRVDAEQRAIAARAESERLAITDALTGLWNRRHFETSLIRCASAVQRSGWALLLIDTDFFKRYNDCYGHLAGDRALEGVAHILADHAQTSGGEAFRIGGEEFAVLVPCPEREALALAEAIRLAVVDLGLPHIEHPRGILTLSIGVAHGARMPDGPPRDWFNRADEALYEAKRLGRNRVCALPGVRMPEIVAVRPARWSAAS